jgi:hypothetical protein
MSENAIVISSGIMGTSIDGRRPVRNSDGPDATGSSRFRNIARGESVPARR